MRVYRGKLNTNTNYTTKDKVITLSTSSGFRQDTSAVLTGQWTVSYKDTPKANYSTVGTITKLDGEEIELFVGKDKYH